MKKFYRYLILLAGAYFLLILNIEINQPKYRSIRELSYLQINSLFGTWFNDESLEFIYTSTHPSELLENPKRQSRPAYVLSGSLLGYSVYGLTTPLHPIIDRMLDKVLVKRFPEENREKLRLWFCHYTGFILLNFGIILVALWLFEKILFLNSGAWNQSRLLLNSLLLLLCCNQLTKFFLWVPHTQLFNILTPLLCIYIALIFPKMLQRFPKSLLFTGSMGVLLLFYGNFLLVLPPLIICYLWNNLAGFRKFPVLHIIRVAALIGCFFLPLLVWIAVLKWNGGSFDPSELKNFRQFIWIADTLKISTGTFWSALLWNSRYFFQTLGSLLFPIGLILYLLFFTSSGANKSFQNFYLIPVLIFGEIIVFFWLLGYYADRLSFTASVPLYCIIAIMLNIRTISQRQSAFITGIILSWILLNLITHPTHLGSSYFS